MPIQTLKKRSEFLRLRGGQRWACAQFVIETKPRIARPASEPTVVGCRFGFTVTKAMGTAVVRNKIRRRLKSAVQALPPLATLPNHDYVLVARQDALTCDFAELQKALERGLQRVHHARESSPKRRP